MKKTLKITMSLCLIIVMMLTVSCQIFPHVPTGEQTGCTTPEETTPKATAPEATTPEATTPEATTPETTTPEEDPDPDQPEDSVRVDSINGKSAREVLEQFEKDFAAAESYDWSSAMQMTEDDIVMQQFISLKYYNGELALLMESDDVFYACYFVDGMLYVNINDQKTKTPGESVDEVLGEGALESFIEAAGSEFDISDEELEKVDAANIYYEASRYTVTIHTVDEETGLEETVHFYFNKDGEFTSAASYYEGGYMFFSVQSYNKPVEITPPADADDFVLQGGSTTPTPEIPEGAVAVDSLNGMNASQLYEKFIAEFSSATSFDIEMLMQETDGLDSYSLSIVTKLTANAVYYATTMIGLGDTVPMEVWLIDGVCYINFGGTKIKYDEATTEEILGEGNLESILGSFTQNASPEYMAALSTAQLYRLDDVYFYTVTVSMPEMGYDSVSETVYFNKNGRVIGVTDIADGYYMESTLNTYGGYVEILPPDDADEYQSEGTGNVTPTLPESQDDIYALYTDICTTLQNATQYSLYFYIDDELMANYDVAGSDRYLAMWSGESITEQWLINNIGYAATDYQAPQKTTVTTDFLEAFTSFEAFLPIDILSKTELQNLRCSYNAEYGEIVIEFEYSAGDGQLSHAKYAIPYEGGYVDITITEFVNGVEEGTYNFFIVNDPELEIVLPEEY